MWKKAIIGFIILAVIVVLTTLPLKNEQYTVMEKYQDTDTYIEMEKYQDVETYWDKIEQSLKYSVTNTQANNNLSLSLGAYAEAFVSVRNTDDIPGIYDVDFTFNLLVRTLSDSVRLYIEPGQSETARGVANINLGEDWNWNYHIKPGCWQPAKWDTF